MVALEEARRLFDYDPASGSIKWRVSLKTARAGDAAGSGNGDGYRQVSVGGKRYMTHRMAWFLYYGSWPAGVIDHINGIRGDNRIANLRDTTVSFNCSNRRLDGAAGKSSLLGAQWNKRKQCWQSAYKPSGKPRVFLGLFDTAEAAHAAYVAAKTAETSQKSCAS